MEADRMSPDLSHFSEFEQGRSGAHRMDQGDERGVR
jgi:hypothetical protein